MDEAELIGVFEAAWSNEGFLSREHEAARLEAGRAALRLFRTTSSSPARSCPAWVEREFLQLGGDRIRGRFDRVDIVPRDRDGRSRPAAGRAAGRPVVLRADVLEPTLDLLGRERVTITDYKSSDVRDPVKARQRARDSLQLQIYAMAYEAMTGRLPDAVQLNFLDRAWSAGRRSTERRLDKAREAISSGAAGIRARDFEPRPDPLACTYCPFREICPASAAR